MAQHVDTTCAYQNSTIYTGSFSFWQVRTEAEQLDVTRAKSSQLMTQKFASWKRCLQNFLHRMDPIKRRLLTQRDVLFPFGKFREKELKMIKKNSHCEVGY